MLPQPTGEIASLLGEIDDGVFKSVSLADGVDYSGYVCTNPPPRVVFPDPLGVGSLYMAPAAVCKMKKTGKRLPSGQFEAKITGVELESSGSGFSTSFPSKVYVENPAECGGVSRETQARRLKINSEIVPRVIEQRAQEGTIFNER